MKLPVLEIIDLKYEKSEWEDWEVIVFSHVKIEARNKSDSFLFKIETLMTCYLIGPHLNLSIYVLETFCRSYTTLLAHYKWNFLELHFRWWIIWSTQKRNSVLLRFVPLCIWCYIISSPLIVHAFHRLKFGIFLRYV